MLMPQPVLNYHAIGHADSGTFAQWVVDPEAFAEHLDFLQTRGLRAVTMRAALADPRPDQIALTFDDGYEDFVSAAAPALEQRGFSASVFVATDHIGDTARWLHDDGAADRPLASWDQLRDVDARGFEVGSHSHTHAHLDLLSDDALRTEVYTSRSTIAEQLGHQVDGFCYPHGFHGARVRSAVVDAGYTYACGVKHKMGSTGQDRHSIARIVVRRGDTTDQLDRWLAGKDLRTGGPAIEKTLAWGFRQYRRLTR